MASYKPPNENLPIFDSELFNNANTAIPDVSDTYLTFPVAQGAETLKDTTISGDLLCLQTVEINGTTTINNGLFSDSIQAGTITGTSEISTVDSYCTTLHYTNLDPPISGVAEPISKVLQNGNNALNETLINLGGLVMTGDIDLQFQQINNWNNGTIGNYLNVLNNNSLGSDTRAQFGVYNDSGTNGYIIGIGDLSGQLNEFNTFKIEDKNTNQQYLRIDNASTQQITLASDKLLYKKDSTNPPSATAYILNSLSNPPMFKQIFYNISNSISNKNLTAPYWLWATKLYDGDTVFNYGVNYGELLLSYFSITITSPSAWIGTNNCQLYLGNGPSVDYDSSLGNRIVFNCTNNSSGDANFTFTSTIPIILYYQNGDSGSSFQTLYFLVSFQDAGIYSFQFNNCNFVSTGTIAGKITTPLAIND